MTKFDWFVLIAIGLAAMAYLCTVVAVTAWLTTFAIIMAVVGAIRKRGFWIGVLTTLWVVWRLIATGMYMFGDLGDIIAKALDRRRKAMVATSEEAKLKRSTEDVMQNFTTSPRDERSRDLALTP